MRASDPKLKLASIRAALMEQQHAAAELARQHQERTRKDEISRQIFFQAIRGVTPMPASNRGPSRALRVAPAPRVPPPVPAGKTPDPVPQLSDGDATPVPQAMDESANFVREGVSRLSVRRLRRGHWQVAAILDLHGMTREIARGAVSRLLSEAEQKCWRCIRIVHGKGLGSRDGAAVLRTLVRRWLAQSATVMAFAQAGDADGGAGALLVLVKSRTRSPAFGDV